MRYIYENMTEKYAEEICYKWKYSGEYSFYDMTEDKEDLEEFLDPQNWDRYFVVKNSKKILGFFIYKIKDDSIFIGLGMKPEFTGRGFGKDFLLSNLSFLKKSVDCSDKKIRLCVAEFNKRAISLYKRVGFKPYMKYIQKTNGGEYPFIKMELR